MTRTKLSAAEKKARKHDRKAAALTAHAAKDFGPLFAHLAPTYTREDAYWHWRRSVALGVERLHTICGGGQRALAAVQVRWIEHHARRWLGDESFGKLRDHAHRTYGDYLGYAYGFWCDVLTGGKRFPMGLTREPDPTTKLGFRVRPVDEQPPAEWVAPLTRDLFWAMFPYAEAAEGPEPDDGGLFERTIGRLADGGRDLAHDRSDS
jgi:hypothetical protein